MKSAIRFLFIVVACGVLGVNANAQFVTQPTATVPTKVTPPTTPAGAAALTEPVSSLATQAGGVMDVQAQITGQAGALGQNLTPDQTKQLQQLMMLRALQMRGRHQVKTGYPQIIGGGVPTLDPPVTVAPDSSANNASKQPSSSQKRAEARRQLREQQKQSHQKDAKAAKALKAKVDKAKADKKPRDVQPSALHPS